MTGLPRRGAAVAALALACAVTAPEAAASSSAVAVPGAPASGTCEGDSGVTVVVDFGELGGGVQTRCAPEPVTSGFEALTGAGFTWEGTARFPGLLCRIDGKPSPQQDACQNAPSARFYWAYWTAPGPGGPWTYSDLGAGNRDPAPGTVEGWAFSVGCKRQPAQPTPCPATTTTAAPSTTTGPSPGALGSGSSASSAPGPSGPGSTLPARPGASSGTSEPAGAPPTSGASDLPRHGTDGVRPDPASDERTLDTRPSASSRPVDDGGSPAGVLAGALAVLVLVAAAVRHARRRGLPTTPGAE